MRIVIDVTPLSLPRTGIGNYLRGMLEGLVEKSGERHELVAFGPTGPWGKRRIESSLDGLPVERRLPVLPRAHWWRTAWSRLGRPAVERVAGPLDVFHFSDWMYPSQRDGVRATTIYDLIPLRFPDWVHPRTRRMHSAKYAHVRTCDVVFAISQFTAEDVAERLGIAPERLVVAYPGISRELRPAGPTAGGGPYVLTVSTLEPRKNLRNLVTAFSLVRQHTPELTLAVVGQGRELGGEGVRLLGYVADEELARLYRGASVFVYPSLFEGFGIPVVEAMACGVPVVASQHPSLDEACGDAALRAEANEPEAIAEAIERALADPAPLVERGLAHASKFTWGACGEAVLTGYERASDTLAP